MANPVIESDYVTCNRIRSGYCVTFNDGSSKNVRFMREARALAERAAALPNARDMTPSTERAQTIASLLS
jgi:hypothetical protein